VLRALYSFADNPDSDERDYDWCLNRCSILSNLSDTKVASNEGWVSTQSGRWRTAALEQAIDLICHVWKIGKLPGDRFQLAAAKGPSSLYNPY